MSWSLPPEREPSHLLAAATKPFASARRQRVDSSGAPDICPCPVDRSARLPPRYLVAAGDGCGGQLLPTVLKGPWSAACQEAGEAVLGAQHPTFPGSASQLLAKQLLTLFPLVGLLPNKRPTARSYRHRSRRSVGSVLGGYPTVVSAITTDRLTSCVFGAVFCWVLGRSDQQNSRWRRQERPEVPRHRLRSAPPASTSAVVPPTPPNQRLDSDVAARWNAGLRGQLRAAWADDRFGP
jgi:hypothetical protein